MTAKELAERQKWTLEQKIDHSLGTIEAFIARYGVEGCYIAFSGGKDSTVLLHLVRIISKEVPAVFSNTGNEYPEIVQFVKMHQKEWNIITIRPSMTPRQVWAKYGFPLVGKETADKIHKVRYNPSTATAKKIMGSGYFSLSQRWRFLINELYETSPACCDILKKRPFHVYERQTGRRPITGVMAEESKLRAGQYIRAGGCNIFGKKPASRPLSIWTNNDIWEYIRRYSIDIADIYHKGAQRTGCMGCGFGAHFHDDARFRLLHHEHPKCFDMIMNYENNGITFREAIRKVLNVTGRYLPDEEPPNLFNSIVD